MKLSKHLVFIIFAICVIIIHTIIFCFQSNSVLKKDIEFIVKHKLQDNNIENNTKLINPIILTINGQSLSYVEKQIIKEFNPFGILLHCDNIKNRAKTIKLISDVKKLVKRDDIHFMIDQEGGRVDRLKCLTKNKYPAPYYYGNIAEKDLEKAKRMVYDNSAKMAQEMSKVGIDFNFAPVLDVISKSSDIKNSQSYISSKNTKEDIGDRAFSHNYKIISALGEQFIKGMTDNGVLVTVKHMPGLGSSTVNSHYELPIINTSLRQLKQLDFIPFKQLNYNYALVAHAKYTSIDSENISTFSKKVVDTIRNDIGFKGILITDALNMKALGNISTEEKIQKSLDAGFDVVMPYFITSSIHIFRELLETIPEENIIKFNEKLAKLKKIS